MKHPEGLQRSHAKYYPIVLDMDGRPCLVIGGGTVAERKVDGLLQAGARVTVISPRLTERLTRWRDGGRIHHQARDYRTGDLSGYQVAFVATDDREINRAAFEEGRDRGVWVNAADDPAHCDFILPSVLRRGELIVAVASGGLSPALCRVIREELDSYFDEHYAVLAEIVGEVRRLLQNQSHRASAEKWHDALDENLRRLIQQGKREGAKAYLLSKLGATLCA